MKQFDVCLVASRSAVAGSRNVVILQHNVLSGLETIVVAPLFAEGTLPIIRRLRPLTRVSRKTYVVAVDLLATIPRHRIGKSIGDVHEIADDIRNALDLVFAGF